MGLEPQPGRPPVLAVCLAGGVRSASSARESVWPGKPARTVIAWRRVEIPRWDDGVRTHSIGSVPVPIRVRRPPPASGLRLKVVLGQSRAMPASTCEARREAGFVLTNIAMPPDRRCRPRRVRRSAPMQRVSRRRQRRSNTSSRASSTLRISSSVKWPTWSPSMRTSTGPTSSHIVRVGSPPTAISGWKLAGGVELEVGQTRIVESVRRSSAWTITAKRRPCWTCPRRRGSVIACTSPRTTELLHQCRNLAGFADVSGIPSERCRLCSESGAPAFPLGRFRDCLACRFGPGHAPAPCDLVECA